MTDFDFRLKYHALCSLLKDVLNKEIISLKEYYLMLNKITKIYRESGASPPETSREKGGDM